MIDPCARHATLSARSFFVDCDSGHHLLPLLESKAGNYYLISLYAFLPFFLAPFHRPRLPDRDCWLQARRSPMEGPAGAALFFIAWEKKSNNEQPTTLFFRLCPFPRLLGFCLLVHIDGGPFLSVSCPGSGCVCVGRLGCLGVSSLAAKDLR